ncbi:MAG: site-2 protease family protein [Acidimicrobiia bacterium]
MNVQLAVLYFGSLVVAVILHEIAHGAAAHVLGDATAKEAGRLTLNPIRHIDPFGSLLLPAMGALTGMPVIGWAKPVPVNSQRLRHPRRDMLLVSFAGPATNVVLAIVAAIFTRLMLGLVSGSGGGVASELVVEIPYTFAVVNLLLGVFNMLPIPPLDGSAIVELFLPDRWRDTWNRFRPFGILLLMALVFFVPSVLRSVLEPFFHALQAFIIG